MIRSLLLAGGVWLGVACAVQAQTCATYPNTLTNGAVADANQVMANFNCAALRGNGLFTGNVGIGTTSPYAPLDLGTALATIKVATYEGGGGDFYGIGVTPAN